MRRPTLALFALCALALIFPSSVVESAAAQSWLGNHEGQYVYSNDRENRVILAHRYTFNTSHDTAEQFIKDRFFPDMFRNLNTGFMLKDEIPVSLLPKAKGITTIRGWHGTDFRGEIPVKILAFSTSKSRYTYVGIFYNTPQDDEERFLELCAERDWLPTRGPKGYQFSIS